MPMITGRLPTSPAFSSSKRRADRRRDASSASPRRPRPRRRRRVGRCSAHPSPRCRRPSSATPAVIADDDLLLRRLRALVDADVAAEPEHGDPVGDLEDVVQVVRDDARRASPCSARRLTRSSTCRVWATPSAAVGSSRMTTREFHITARATATDWRCPPESVATGCRIERIVVTDERLQRLGRPLLHRRLVQPEDRVVHLAAEVHVLDDVEVVAEREILVDDLDPEPRRVLRAVDRDRLAVEEHLARVDRVDPRDALDQRRLAGAVVADERHHLAVAHLEVDVARAPGPSRRSSRCRAARGSGASSPRECELIDEAGAARAGRPARSTASTCSTSRTARRRPGSSSGTRP